MADAPAAPPARKRVDYASLFGVVEDDGVLGGAAASSTAAAEDASVGPRAAASVLRRACMRVARDVILCPLLSIVRACACGVWGGV